MNSNRYRRIFDLALGTLVLLAGQPASAQGRPSIADLQARIAELEAAAVPGLGAYVEVTTSQSGLPVVLFHDVNVQVVNGLGNTSSVNGLGNLVVGYDELRDGSAYQTGFRCSSGANVDQPTCEQAGYAWGIDHKSGSHNLVVGPFHNYMNAGGIVGGVANVSSGRATTVAGGSQNEAAATYSAIAGGNSNITFAGSSAIAGGRYNHAAGDYATVAGGSGNVASGESSSVAGGLTNTASGAYAGVAGGSNNIASGNRGSVGGGYYNLASGNNSTVSGGAVRTSDAQYEWSAGGLQQPQ